MTMFFAASPPNFQLKDDPGGLWVAENGGERSCINVSGL